MKFVFDLDGTICFKGKPLSPNMVACLDRLVKEGHELIFASARPIRDLLPILPEHLRCHSLVGGNGGFVQHGGRLLSVSYLDNSLANQILQLLHSYNATYLIDSDWDYCYTGAIDHPIRQNLDPEGAAQNLSLDELSKWVKIVILQSSNFEQLYMELADLPVALYLHGNENIIDISPQGIDKWTGLQQLGVQAHAFIAFGNDANDVPMFKQANYSVCVGNHADLLAVSTDKTSSDEEAVISKIEEIAANLPLHLLDIPLLG
ncbi:HAD family hydrolase [Paenibacillus sp. N1-5-1-14]|uniref:HAD family hydrolase n=1 Tax=Paenibacillus radicibacter TaxID=2972488 RepID=UPI0021594A75|nr:HAD family hydrolase [Paenibacillus radicibacter]MCR8641026.1 HAD family hydrolase [Paenibacillus radicibacter]